MNLLRFAAVAAFFTSSAFAAAPSSAPRTLPDCGQLYHDTGHYTPDGYQDRRPCGTPAPRAYQPHYRGLAYEVLDLESEACFVPDESYRFLDAIIAQIHARIDAEHLALGAQASAAAIRRMSEITVDTIDANSFDIYIPTPRLAAALMERRHSAYQASHIYDCDVGSMILLTIAEQYGVAASMVEVQLSKEATHNYVRFSLSGAEPMDWDTNQRGQCVTPTDQQPWHGVAMTRDEVFGYVTGLRAYDWEGADSATHELQDRQRAMQLWTAHPGPSNNFAWFIATTDFPERQQYAAEALSAAERAVSLDRNGSYLDTLACVHAWRGDFGLAAETEEEALDLVDDPETKASFAERIARFRAEVPRDCTGD